MATLGLGKGLFRQIRQPRPSVLRPTTNFTIRQVPKVQPLSRNYATLPPTKYKPPQPLTAQYKRFQHNQKVPFYLSKRVWVFFGTGTVIFGGYYVTHLEKVPISGRSRFMSITPRQEEAMAIQAYNEVMQQFGRRILPENHPYTKFVKRVAKRLVKVSGMEDMKWEFYVVDSPEKNAFVLPGGKVFVFTGILPVVANEDGMAAVLGHEISHQIARHSAEKLSFAKILLAIQISLSLLGVDPSFIFNRFTTNFLVMMPFSRKCETEADDIGLKLMSQACFDPRESIEVWKRMEKLGEVDVPQFASTHPSHKNRISYLTNKLPAAMDTRAQSDCSTDMHRFSDQFRATNWARW